MGSVVIGGQRSLDRLAAGPLPGNTTAASQFTRAITSTPDRLPVRAIHHFFAIFRGQANHETLSHRQPHTEPGSAHVNVLTPGITHPVRIATLTPTSAQLTWEARTV